MQFPESLPSALAWYPRASHLSEESPVFSENEPASVSLPSPLARSSLLEVQPQYERGDGFWSAARAEGQLCSLWSEIMTLVLMAATVCPLCPTDLPLYANSRRSTPVVPVVPEGELRRRFGWTNYIPSLLQLIWGLQRLLLLSLLQYPHSWRSGTLVIIPFSDWDCCRCVFTATVG